MRNIIDYKDYGEIEITLKQVIEKKKTTVYQISKMTNVKYQTVKNYYDNVSLSRVDLDVVAKLCYVLDCKVEDILKYNGPHL